MLRRLALATVLMLLAAPGAARGDTLSASADSPRDPALPAGQDIERAVMTFDDEAGTWSVRLTTYGEAGDADWSAINAILFDPPAAGAPCGGRADDSIAVMRASTRPGDSTIVGSINPTIAIRRAQAVSRDDDGTLLLTDTALVGKRPGCATVNLSRNRVLDSVTLALTAPTPGAPPAPGATDTPSADDPPTPRFTHADARLTASRGGLVTVALQPFGRAVTGSVTLGPTSGAGLAYGTATYRARAGDPVLLRVRLTAAARRALTRARRLSVRITATARAGDRTLTRTTRATIRPA